MEVGDGEAQTAGGLESARGGVHSNRWRRKRVIWREDQRAPVLSTMVRGILRSCNDVMPPGSVYRQSRVKAALPVKKDPMDPG